MSNNHNSIIAVDVTDARKRLSNALNSEHVASTIGNTNSRVRVAENGVLITIFYDTDNGHGPPEPGVMPISIHMSAEILCALIGITKGHRLVRP